MLAAALAFAAATGRPAAAQDISPVPLDAFGRGAERSKGNERAADLPPAPRLVVAMIVDQYRDDLLDRYLPVFGKDGFRRLLDGGTRFRDCTIPYSATWTSPGHATWLSGASPSVHGVIANSWYDRAAGRSVDSTEDPSVRVVGAAADSASSDPESGGRASPWRMRAQTVGDVLRSTTGGVARVVALSDKSTSAALSAGRRPNGAYWVGGRDALLETSSWYADELPGWVRAANAARRDSIAAARSRPWTPVLGDAQLLATGGADPQDRFPHALSSGDGARDPAGVGVSHHPVGLTTFFDFAEAAVEHEGLGADGTPDLLILSVSITDRVGHRWGPDSPEALDLAHRLDARLARFLHVLDERVGRGRWALSLTSDHGIPPAPVVARRFEAAAGDSVGGLSSRRVREWVERVLRAALPKQGFSRAAGVDSFVAATGAGFVTFDDARLARAGVTRADAARVVADSAAAHPWFAAAFTADDLARVGASSSPLAARVARSFFPGRSGDVVLVPRPNVFFGSVTPTYRTNHGSPWRYDTHVPLLFYGWGIRKGSHWAPVSTVDIAATVAALLGIAAPAQSEGRVLEEALGPPRKGER